MNIFVDENIPKITVKTLIENEHHVIDIRNTEKEGIPDAEIWENVLKNKALLITTDKGFSRYRNQRHYGILIVRLKKPDRIKIHKRIIYAVYHFSKDDWKNRLVVVKDNVMSSWKKS